MLIPFALAFALLETTATFRHSTWVLNNIWNIRGTNSGRESTRKIVEGQANDRKILQIPELRWERPFQAVSLKQQAC